MADQKRKKISLGVLIIIGAVLGLIIKNIRIGLIVGIVLGLIIYSFLMQKKD